MCERASVCMRGSVYESVCVRGSVLEKGFVCVSECMSECERESVCGSVYVAVETQISRVLLKMEHLNSVKLSLSLLREKWRG